MKGRLLWETSMEAFLINSVLKYSTLESHVTKWMGQFSKGAGEVCHLDTVLLSEFYQRILLPVALTLC